MKTARDHPRVGGEKFLIRCLGLLLMGSPPRGRGKENKKIKWYKTRRITPAWAGKSKRLVQEQFLFTDHPRVGGEKLHRIQILTCQVGSPPRGRGKVPDTLLRSVANGITPAWAGKRKQKDKMVQNEKDHPRVGGEKVSSASPMKRLKGSPPRGRGKEVKTTKDSQTDGITPAWAGKSFGISGRYHHGRDHPRVGGEK